VFLRSRFVEAVAREPDARRDVQALGLIATLLTYWRRWKASPDPQVWHPVSPVSASDDVPELVVIVQCESFADPAELFGDAGLELPGLASARDDAWQWGQLGVSGFGAYTMRTEFAVLFGRSEEQLGFRRYDPFLTALSECSHALPAKLRGSGWRSVFVHPHDMRFYGRDRIMPAAGFAELVGEEAFAPSEGEHWGRYVPDEQVTRSIVAQAKSATERTLIYAVTIENHGPWAPQDGGGLAEARQGYVDLVRNGDRMLTTLRAELARLEKPALLVFFGDHRPSIPGLTDPQGDRHTPYVIMQWDRTGNVITGPQARRDISAAELHHVVLDALFAQPR